MIPPAPFALPPAPSAPATEPLPPASPIAAGISEQFLRRDAMELARRIVAKMDDTLQLATSMGLTELQWDVLRHHPHFERCLQEAQAEANSAQGLADRVRLKALMVLDQGGILDMAGVLVSPQSTPVNRIQAFNSLVEVSGLAKQKDQQANQVGGGPLVQIVFPESLPATIKARVVSEQ